MHLIQILLPIRTRDGEPISEEAFLRTREELIQQFGGVTAYLRAPARGLWRSGEGDVTSDDVVILEVMARDLERRWWGEFRTILEGRFGQEEVVVRAMWAERL